MITPESISANPSLITSLNATKEDLSNVNVPVNNEATIVKPHQPNEAEIFVASGNNNNPYH